MNREQLIQSIVARKLANPGMNKIGCVPCFGFAQKAGQPRTVKQAR